MIKHRPLVLWPLPDPKLYGWLARMLANCTEDAYRRNKGRMVRLAEYSRDMLRDIRGETGIQYDHRECGTLQLFRTQKQLDHVGDDTGVLDDFSVPYEILDRDGCVRAEPALAFSRHLFVGGLRLPGDETGDAHLFTQRLAAICRDRGVIFRYGDTIEALEIGAGKITGVRLAGSMTLRADAYVAALGSFTPALLKPLGVSLPIYPVKGYSLTIPIADDPLSMDSRRQTVIEALPRGRGDRPSSYCGGNFMS